MRPLKRCTTLFAVIVCGYLAAAVVGALIPNAAKPAPQSWDHTIYLLVGTIHTDVVLPLDEKTRAAFGFAQPTVSISNPSMKWLIIGWGSKEFYTRTPTYADLKPTTVWRAITGDTAVLHIATLSDLPENYRTHPIGVDHRQYNRLLDFITEDISKESLIENVSYGYGDAFFNAPGRFNIFRTCNVWIAKALDHAWIKFGIWTPTPFAINLSYKRFVK